MKKVVTTFITIIMTAVLVLGGLIAYDEYKEVKEREMKRWNRNVRNDLVFNNYDWGEFAIDAFNDGYTVTIYYLRGPEDILNGTYCELGNVNDDTLADFISKNPSVRVTHIERENYSRQLEIYRNVEV